MLKMKIINRSPFYWGIGITIALLFVHIFTDGQSGHGGNMLKNLSIYGKIISLIPGGLLIFNGLLPNSMLGKAGGLIYNFYSWVYRESKKK